jgi:hypothetical protein
MSYVSVAGGAELAALHAPVEAVPYPSRLAQAVVDMPMPTPAETTLANIGAEIAWTEFRDNQQRHIRQTGKVLLTTLQVTAKVVEAGNKTVSAMSKNKYGRYVLFAASTAAAGEYYHLIK